jgi:hypothetical protein
MSIIKSSNEHLTLNADGANNDIKFQSNGSEVASIDQAGTITATTFTGAATDATKLPLAGGTMTGQLIAPSIRTSGSVSGNFNTIINSTNQYGLNVVSTGTTGSHDILKIAGGNGTAFSVFGDNGATLTGNLIVGDTSSNESFIKISDDDTNAYIGAEASAAWFGMDSAIASGSNLGIYADGRGLSQFTAKFWAVIRSTPTDPVFRDSHNCASITDHATGDITVNLTNDMGQADFCVVASCGSATNNPSDKNAGAVPVDAGAARVEIYERQDGGHVDLEYISVLGFAD